MTQAARGEQAVWTSEGVQTNPDTTTVLADTGQLPVGDYICHVIIGINNTAAAVATLGIQWRNAANSGNNEEQRLYYPASLPSRDGYTFPFRSDAANERVRIIPIANVTGTVSASIFWQKAD